MSNLLSEMLSLYFFQSHATSLNVKKCSDLISCKWLIIQINTLIKCSKLQINFIARPSLLLLFISQLPFTELY